TPSLESARVLSFGIIAAFLASRCPSTTAQSNSHNCLDRQRIPPSSPLLKIII
ncbi:hypothetical protein B296_00022133, partial [Ensete ventricosum]